MDTATFNSTIAEAKEKNPAWFGLPTDRPAVEDDIEHAEEKLGAKFPKEYSFFLSQFGGGYFAFTVIYSLDKSSDWNILEINELYDEFRSGYLLVSENGSGDFYGFRIVDGSCKPRVCFRDHETDVWSPTEYGDILEFVVGTGLKT